MDRFAAQRPFAITFASFAGRPGCGVYGRASARFCCERIPPTSSFCERKYRMGVSLLMVTAFDRAVVCRAIDLGIPPRAESARLPSVWTTGTATSASGVKPGTR